MTGHYNPAFGYVDLELYLPDQDEDTVEARIISCELIRSTAVCVINLSATRGKVQSLIQKVCSAKQVAPMNA